jgi:16S rRNA G966 N2-methylase RsmD/DNA-directed RNA polymerase subunit RPC12/RpoP
MRKMNQPSKNVKSGGRGAVLDILYKTPLASERTGALYSAFPYPTKISPESIALFIAAHTKPGDTVFDGFAGSGTTGLAALLCENPPAELRAKAKRLGLNVKWGARNAILYELSALGAFVGRTLTAPPKPSEFKKAAEAILAETEKHFGWLYAAHDTAGKYGRIRHMVWSDQFLCSACKRSVTLWDAAVSFSPARIASDFRCPHCKHKAPIKEARRTTERQYDDLIQQNRTFRTRRPAFVYGKTANKTWARPAQRSDLELIKKIEREPIPDCVPRTAIPWGDLHRTGYHEGISHLHHFYTRRNLIAFGHLWERANEYEGALRNALRFWLLSYNASHSTIMTRVVAKAGQNDLVVTSAQNGVLYVSGLPVEKNVFAGVRRKLETVTKAFETVYGRKAHVSIRQKSSCKLDLLDESIDYAFIDPPFGGNIPYAEVNFINEAWLGDFTDTTDEVIVSKHQTKSIKSYEDLMTQALQELHRVLKASAQTTMVFHSASSDIWNALQNAYRRAGYGVQRASVLDKTQASFKQVTAEGAVRGDAVLLLVKQAVNSKRSTKTVWEIAAKLQQEAGSAMDPTERTPQRLYSRLVTHFLTRDQPVPLDADAFYAWYAGRQESNRHFDTYA